MVGSLVFLRRALIIVSLSVITASIVIMVSNARLRYCVCPGSQLRRTCCLGCEYLVAVLRRLGRAKAHSRSSKRRSLAATMTWWSRTLYDAHRTGEGVGRLCVVSCLWWWCGWLHPRVKERVYHRERNRLYPCICVHVCGEGVMRVLDVYPTACG